MGQFRREVRGPRINREQALRRRSKALTWLFTIGLMLNGIWHYAIVALPKMGG